MQNYNNNPHPPPLIYISQFRPVQTYPQSWPGMSLQDLALIFTMKLDYQDVIIMIQNPMDIAQIVMEGMQLGTNIYNQYLWAMHPPHSCTTTKHHHLNSHLKLLPITRSPSL